METNEQMQMIVWWENQRRTISISITDDLKTIEKKINTIYQLKQGNDLGGYQPQYYDSDYQHFLDLYPDSFNSFQQLLERLSSPQAPGKSMKEWTLRIVPKVVQPIRQAIRESITADDTYSYQQENDPSDLHTAEESVTANLRTPALRDGSSNDNPEVLPRDPLGQNTDTEGQVPAQLNHQLSRSGATNDPIMITIDHPCGLSLEVGLTETQRQQYEKDMSRNNSSKSAKGGVRLRARPKPGGTASTDKSYPVIHFRIPSDKESLEWYLILFILTEADTNGAHYLHSSKGIYLGEMVRENRCCAIRDSHSVNPYAIRLTLNQIRDGAVEILIKVCNVRDLPTRKKEQLKQFSQSANPKDYDRLTSLSTNTMHSLQFANESFHLGCALICGETIYDQCISNLTTAVPNGKRGDSDLSNPTGNPCKKTKK